MFQPSLPRAAVSQCRWVEAGVFFIFTQCSGLQWIKQREDDYRMDSEKCIQHPTSDVLLTEKKAKRLEIQKLKSASASRY